MIRCIPRRASPPPHQPVGQCRWWACGKDVRCGTSQTASTRNTSCPLTRHASGERYARACTSSRRAVLAQNLSPLQWTGPPGRLAVESGQRRGYMVHRHTDRRPGVTRRQAGVTGWGGGSARWGKGSDQGGRADGTHPEPTPSQPPAPSTVGWGIISIIQIGAWAVSCGPR